MKLLARRSGKSETEYANRMVLYIFNTGLDIYTEIAPNVPDQLKKLEKKFIGFLKKREQDFFVPMEKSFREMVRVHNQTLETLDILHPGEIGFESSQKKEAKNKEQPSFKIPEVQGSKIGDLIIPEEAQKIEIKSEETNQFTEEKKEEYLVKIERAEKEKKTFEKELKYLLKNIVPSNSISGPKFTCNLPQKEIDRINHLVDGN
ncbi:hypothetical protein HME9304_01786 [Flagellimonas maritima]|uniref:Uncharacterized protein n=2 Tax=Flagellimonas maritima TaxID=1383885 RepID=A0A2Z4LS93_9FLAO|nr:hypothetical protein HME9304_01786 [Allomuricauda aurantiaca]